MWIKNTVRAIRRHHRNRMIQHAKKIMKYLWNYDSFDEKLHEHASRNCDNITRCSCPMCCNQRHNDWQPNRERLTMQERREKERFDVEKNLLDK